MDIFRILKDEVRNNDEAVSNDKGNFNYHDWRSVSTFNNENCIRKNSNQNKKKVNRLREFLVTRVKAADCFDVLYNAKVKLLQ